MTRHAVTAAAAKVLHRRKSGWYQVNVYLAQCVLLVTLFVAAMLYLAVAYLNAKWPIYLILFSYTIFLVPDPERSIAGISRPTSCFFHGTRGTISLLLMTWNILFSPDI